MTAHRRRMAVPFVCECPALTWLVAGRCNTCGGHLRAASRLRRWASLLGSAGFVALLAWAMAFVAAPMH